MAKIEHWPENTPDPRLALAYWITEKEEMNECQKEILAGLKEGYLKKFAERFAVSPAPIKWKCAGCLAFLNELAAPKQVEDFIIDFVKGKYVLCPKCKLRNFFIVTDSGRLAFIAYNDKGRDTRFMKSLRRSIKRD